jgi:radical SAM protein (TIGR04043 family)/putative N-acetyltransferase (TIGR04045 family)
VELPAAPSFYRLATADGVPYWKIALLHARRVLASTVMQSCVRYNDSAQACRFCAIGTSLKEGRTLARKTPAQLAEVAEAAVRLDGIEQMVLTTGTPATPDRGAAHLAACLAAIKQAVPSLPIQVQCEPPDDLSWLARLKEAGADTIGMHLEAVEPAVRAAVMPGKAELSLERYDEAFAVAVGLFGRGQVSTYLIAGLGDRPDSLVGAAARLVAMGVYPFVVPFVPIADTPMADARPPAAATMDDLYRRVAALIRGAGLSAADGPLLVRGVVMSEGGAPADERPRPASEPTLICRLARGDTERAGYFALRRAIFCDEQRLFSEDDRDSLDADALPIVCLFGDDPRVVGVVRIWEEAPGDWWGGRLGVDVVHRTAGTIGRRLIRTAVGTARAWGAWRFRATVQRANVPFFRRLRWRSLEELTLFAEPHHLMEADLAAYPPVAEPLPAGRLLRRFNEDHAA